MGHQLQRLVGHQLHYLFLLRLQGGVGQEQIKGSIIISVSSHSHSHECQLLSCSRNSASPSASGGGEKRGGERDDACTDTCSVKRDLVQCQKRPIIVSNETSYRRLQRRLQRCKSIIIAAVVREEDRDDGVHLLLLAVARPYDPRQRLNTVPT